MIARVEISWTMRDRMKELCADPASLHLLRGVFGEHALPESHEPEVVGKFYGWPSETLIDLDHDGPVLASLGIRFEVLNFKGTMPLKHIIPEGFSAGKDISVVIQVPNIGLLAVEQVEVIEDACTDKLQGYLDDGWRILAVCPPNAARRPDYILGRSKEVKHGSR